MKININENRVLFDVDCTLIKPLNEASEQEIKKFPKVIIKSPWGEDSFVELTHVTERVRRHHMQGHHVTIHSQGGWQWAELVVKTLNLEDCVDEVMTKPKWYFDDLPADSWMKRTIP